jgi:hypothetical protein
LKLDFPRKPPVKKDVKKRSTDKGINNEKPKRVVKVKQKPVPAQVHEEKAITRFFPSTRTSHSTEVNTTATTNADVSGLQEDTLDNEGVDDDDISEGAETTSDEEEDAKQDEAPEQSKEQEVETEDIVWDD